MRPNAIAAVATVNAVLAVALGWLWTSAESFRWTEPAPLAPALDDAVAVDAAESTEVSRYRETLERPLFAATRKIAPRASPGAEQHAAVDPLKDVRLLGTYGAGDKGGILVLRGGKVERVPVGARIGEWQVKGHEGRGAALERPGGERRTLELAVNTAVPQAGAAGGSTPAAAEAQTSATPAAAGPGGARAASGGTAKAADQAAQAAAQEKWMREQIERINARRARRGLPPISTDGGNQPNEQRNP
jgi:hypothetical protein